ncbi:hypothetical protein KC19_VG278600 [Ceratodon purpureus]|uniref:Secreted protein n=1 Tax=Ceratodon purpureus TaxID=3225 RepID=A0A8T0HUW2_CERPU|nr:hypothetical protein KC19_VG278600 [Ceratodon purpureus]
MFRSCVKIGFLVGLIAPWLSQLTGMVETFGRAPRIVESRQWSGRVLFRKKPNSNSIHLSHTASCVPYERAVLALGGGAGDSWLAFA